MAQVVPVLAVLAVPPAAALGKRGRRGSGGLWGSGLPSGTLCQSAAGPSVSWAPRPLRTGAASRGAPPSPVRCARCPHECLTECQGEAGEPQGLGWEDPAAGLWQAELSSRTVTEGLLESPGTHPRSRGPQEPGLRTEVSRQSWKASWRRQTASWQGGIPSRGPEEKPVGGQGSRGSSGHLLFHASPLGPRGGRDTWGSPEATGAVSTTSPGVSAAPCPGGACCPPAPLWEGT